MHRRPTVARHRTDDESQDVRGSSCRRTFSPIPALPAHADDVPPEPVPDPRSGRAARSTAKPLARGARVRRAGHHGRRLRRGGRGRRDRSGRLAGHLAALLLVGLALGRRGRGLSVRGAGPPVPVAAGDGVAVLADLEVGALSRIMRPTVLFALVAGAFAVGAALLSAPSRPSASSSGSVSRSSTYACSARASVQAGVAGGVTGASDDQDGDDVGGTANVDVTTLPRLTTSHGRQQGGATPAAHQQRRPAGGDHAARDRPGAGRPPLGIGMVVGLVIFQISFVLNAGRAILSAGIG